MAIFSTYDTAASYNQVDTLTPEAATLTLFDHLKPETNPIALCLSGGGYRATLYHLGAMRRLNELGVLSRVDTISSVSGGSIIAAILAESIATGRLNWPAAGEQIADNQWEDFASRVVRFTRRDIRTSSVMARALPHNWGWPPASAQSLANKYARFISERKLKDLPHRPVFVFCATDMENGAMWIASREQLGSAGTGFGATGSEWRLADAVAASSCFPPIFSPLTVTVKSSAGEDLIHLTDGGNFDNTGVEPVYATHPRLLISDGGGTFDPGWRRSFFWKLQRYSGILDFRGRTMTRRWLDTMASLKTGTVVAMWKIDDPGATSSEDFRTKISEIRTDLDVFSNAEAEALEWHGYYCAEASVRKSGFTSDVPQWPECRLELVDIKHTCKNLQNSHRTKLSGRR